MKASWITDPHLNFIGSLSLDNFIKDLKNNDSDCIFLTGDIAEGQNIIYFLCRLAEVNKNIYFVLGNHDFYHSSIELVMQEVEELCEEKENLIYLSTEKSPIQLTESTYLIGHDGWYDGLNGDFYGSNVLMYDFECIEELKQCETKDEIKTALVEITERSEKHIKKQYRKACKLSNNTICLTHVPPFEDSAWHKGKKSDDNWLPFFSNKLIGEALLSIFNKSFSRRLDVYCGHTHTPRVYCPSKGFTVNTGAAEYGYPEVFKTIEIE